MCQFSREIIVEIVVFISVDWLIIALLSFGMIMQKLQIVIFLHFSF